MQDTEKLVAVDPATLTFNPNHRRLITFPGCDTFLFRSSGLTLLMQGNLRNTIKNFASAIAPLGNDSSPKVDIYVYLHEDYGSEIFQSYQQHYKGNAGRMPQRFYDDFGRVLRSMLLVKGESLADLSPETLKERVRHVVLGSFSAGSIAAHHAAQCLGRGLKEAGWSAEDSAAVIKELVSVDVASVARHDMDGSSGTHIHVTAVNDDVLRGPVGRIAGAASPSVHRACGYSKANIPPTKVTIEPTRTGYNVRCTLPNEVHWDEPLPDGRIQKHSIKANPMALIGIGVPHNFKSFLHGHNEMGRCMRNLLLNALTREGDIGDGHQLFAQHPLNKAVLRSGEEDLEASLEGARPKITSRY